MENPILESKLYVPAHLVPVAALERFKATIKDKETEEDINYDFYDYDSLTSCYRFARGNITLINEMFGNLGIEDRRVSVPMSCATTAHEKGFGIQFTGTLKPSQIPFVEKALHYDYGQYKAPPRFGKTVVMAYLTCKRAQKTLFLSHQIDLSKQALTTFYKFTNVLDLEYQLNRQIVGIVEDWDDLDKFDVAFFPYQKFVNADPAMFEKYKNHFGAIYIDESHKAATPWYTKVVSSFNAKVRQGFTGTIERKDNLHIVNEFIIGPVMAEGVTSFIPCEVFRIDTGIKLPFSGSNMKMFWSKMQSFFNNNFVRNAIIYSYLEAYAKAGHSIIAVTDRSAQCDEMARRLKSAGYSAEAFHSKRFKTNKKQREAVLEGMRTGSIQVMIAQRSMVLGLDIPRLTAFFNLMPTANPPNYYQEFNRCRTPFEGKEIAYIVDFVDDHHILVGCWKNRKKLYVKENFKIHNDQEELPRNVHSRPTSF